LSSSFFFFFPQHIEYNLERGTLLCLQVFSSGYLSFFLFLDPEGLFCPTALPFGTSPRRRGESTWPRDHGPSDGFLSNFPPLAPLHSLAKFISSEKGVCWTTLGHKTQGRFRGSATPDQGVLLCCSPLDKTCPRSFGRY